MLAQIMRTMTARNPQVTHQNDAHCPACLHHERAHHWTA